MSTKMALELIFSPNRRFSKSIEKHKEKQRFCLPGGAQNEPRWLQDSLRTALGPLWVALGSLLAALGSLLAALGSLLVRLEALLAALEPLLVPLGSLLVALEPLWVPCTGALLRSTRIPPPPGRASLLSIAPVMGLVLLYLSIYQSIYPSIH